MDRSKKEIFKLIHEYYDLAHKKEFIPGKTKVHYAGRVYDHKEMIALADSALDFWLTLGKYGKAFESKFSKYLKIKFTAVTNSGSSANLLAISALCCEKFPSKLKKGDEVITTALNFPTTIAPIVQNGLVPVFIDVRPDTYNIDAAKLQKAVSKKTRAIFVAHTLGNPVNLNEIMRFKKKHDLFLIEDNCDALDSRYNNKLTGTFGDLSTFSFYAAHHITMGEGGAVVTDNCRIYKNILSLRDWGRDCWCPTGESHTFGACRKRFSRHFPGLPEGYDHKYTYTNIGYNLKPLDLQCAIGLEQMKKLGGFTIKRKENFKRLYTIFKEYEEYFILPQKEEGSDPSWFAFPLTVRGNAGFTKNQFVKFMEDNLIETRAIFAGNILRHPAYKKIKCRISGGLKNTDNILINSFFVGVYPGIDKTQIEYIRFVVNKFFKGTKK